MRTIDNETFAEIRDLISPEEAAEMAIPSYTHKNKLLSWMAWKRIAELSKLINELALKNPGLSNAVLDYGCGAGVSCVPSSGVIPSSFSGFLTSYRCSTRPLPAPAHPEGADCYAAMNGHSLYFDNHHISIHGARRPAELIVNHIPGR